MELPLGLLSYDGLALQNQNTAYQRAKCISTLLAVARGRKNYKFLLAAEQGNLEYWRLNQPELYAVLTEENTLLDEAFGEGGINSAASRVTNAWGDPAAGRRQLLLHFHNMHQNNGGCLLLVVFKGRAVLTTVVSRHIAGFLQYLQNGGGKRGRQVRPVDLRRGTLTAATILVVAEMGAEEAMGSQPSAPVSQKGKINLVRMKDCLLTPGKQVRTKAMGSPAWSLFCASHDVLALRPDMLPRLGCHMAGAAVVAAAAKAAADVAAGVPGAHHHTLVPCTSPPS